MTGTVADAGFPISDAKVTFVSSAGTVSAMTDHDGTYRLPAAGVVTIRVEKAGYLAYQGELTADGDRQVDVGLSVDGARPELNGIYTMTFTASASCTTLPAYATRRTYTAKIDGTPTAFTVVLTGANFVGWWSEPGFTGRYVGPDVRFNISDDILDDYALIEDLGNGFLAYLGTAIGGVVGKNLVTTFNGTVRVYSGPTSLGTCTASDHRMEFVRK